MPGFPFPSDTPAETNPPGGEARLPPPIPVDLGRSLRSYWLDRVRQHTSDSYMGLGLRKFPEDLRVYEHLLWASRANVVVEIGTKFGGSALWFRDRMRTNEAYGLIEHSHVFSIDLDTTEAARGLAAVDPGYTDRITLIEGDVCDQATADRVAELLPRDARCFVVEDSAHTYETTRAALDGFSHLVPAGGYFVVEDGCVDIDEMRPSDDWPRGVLAALDEWLRDVGGSAFVVRRDLERYGLSCHPYGFLQRKVGPAI
jgi:cephalosporin hydroxylase